MKSNSNMFSQYVSIGVHRKEFIDSSLNTFHQILRSILLFCPSSLQSCFRHRDIAVDTATLVFYIVFAFLFRNRGRSLFISTVLILIAFWIFACDRDASHAKRHIPVSP